MYNKSEIHMNSNKLSKHHYHTIDIVQHNFHIGKLVCKDCNDAYIKWVNDIEYNIFKKGMTYKDLQDHMHMYYNKPNDMIYLAVPYEEKDIAKKLGAYWDPIEKLWYTYCYSKKANKLKNYMLDDDIKRIESLEKYNKVYGDNK